MHRRFFTTIFRTISLSAAVAFLIGCSTLTAQPRFEVSKLQLQQAVAKRFPLQYPILGLVNVEVQAPEIRLLPEQNRLSAAMRLEASGPALNRKQSGSLDIEFALRYEVSDRTLRATAIKFKSLNFPGLQPLAAQMLNNYGQALSEKTLLEVVLHTLKPQDLALADGLGVQPGSITITQSGLVVDFVKKL